MNLQEDWTPSPPHESLPAPLETDWWGAAEAQEPAPSSGGWRRGMCLLTSLILIISLVAGMGGGILGRDWVRARLARDDVSATLNNFMTHLTRAQPDRAYALLSTRGKIRVPQDELEHLVEEGYRLLEDYDYLTIESIQVRTIRQRNPRLPQGTVARVEARIYYSDGVEGQLSAVLEKEGDHWRIYEFYINSPAKLRELQRA